MVLSTLKSFSRRRAPAGLCQVAREAHCLGEKYAIVRQIVEPETSGWAAPVRMADREHLKYNQYNVRTIVQVIGARRILCQKRLRVIRRLPTLPGSRASAA
jgi:hypothetical protein